MQFKQSTQALKEIIKISLLSLSLFPFAAASQTTYLPQDARENILLERLEIKKQKDSILNFSKTRPLSRKQFIPVVAQYFLESTKVLSGAVDDELKKWNKTRVDHYNSQLAVFNNQEWVDSSLRSDRDKG